MPTAQRRRVAASRRRTRVQRHARRTTGGSVRRRKTTSNVKKQQRGGRVTMPSEYFSNTPNANYTQANKTAATKVYFQPDVCPTTDSDSRGIVLTAASTVKHMADKGAKYLNISGGGGSRVRRRVRRKTLRNKRRSKASAKVNQRGGRVTLPSDYYSGTPNANYNQANKTAPTKVYFQPEVCPSSKDSTAMSTASAAMSTASAAASTMKHMADQGGKYFSF